MHVYVQYIHICASPDMGQPGKELCIKTMGLQVTCCTISFWSGTILNINQFIQK